MVRAGVVGHQEGAQLALAVDHRDRQAAAVLLALGDRRRDHRQGHVRADVAVADDLRMRGR
jgi:hypothetical protein